MGSSLSLGLTNLKQAYASLTPQHLLYLELAATLYLAFYGASYLTRAYRQAQVRGKAARRREARDAKRFTFQPVAEEKVQKVLSVREVAQLREMQIRGR